MLTDAFFGLGIESEAAILPVNAYRERTSLLPISALKNNLKLNSPANLVQLNFLPRLEIYLPIDKFFVECI